MASFDVIGERKRSFSHLPLSRFTSVVCVLVALDSLACVSLWIAGGDSLYLESNVTHFSITQSTFDLACIATLRGIIIIASYYYLEQFIITRNSTRLQGKQTKNTRLSMICQALIIMVSCASLVYSVVKGGLLVKKIMEHESIEMHITYKVLCIVSVVFSLMEVFFGVVSSWCIRIMVRERGLRLLINLDLDDEQPVKKKADLKRLVVLARPVRKLDIRNISILRCFFYCIFFHFF